MVFSAHNFAHQAQSVAKKSKFNFIYHKGIRETLLARIISSIRFRQDREGMTQKICICLADISFMKVNASLRS